MFLGKSINILEIKLFFSENSVQTLKMPQMSVLSVKLYFLMYIMLANIPKLGTIIIMAVDIKAFLSFYFLSHEPTEQIESYALYW